MGMKYVKKSKLDFEDGYILYKGDVVAIDPVVVEQLNHFENVVQQFMYVRKQPKYQPEPSLDGWHKKSAIKLRPVISATTPILDAEIEKAKMIMAELDSVSNASAINDAFDRYAELIQWLRSKKVVVYTNPSRLPEQIDTYEIGNPLEISADDFTKMITYMETGEIPHDEEEELDCEECPWNSVCNDEEKGEDE